MVTASGIISQLTTATQATKIEWFAVEPERCNPPVQYYALYSDWNLYLNPADLRIYTKTENLTTITTEEVSLVELYTVVTTQVIERAQQLLLNLYDQLGTEE
jgi:hypothetical protein